MDNGKNTLVTAIFKRNGEGGSLWEKIGIGCRGANGFNGCLLRETTLWGLLIGKQGVRSLRDTCNTKQ